MSYENDSLPSDEELILRAKQGETAASFQLFGRYVNQMTSYIAMNWSSLREKDLVKDVMQEAFISVIKSLHNYNPDDGTFSSWIYCIARARASDVFRRHYQFHRITTKSPEWWEANQEILAEASEEDRSLIKERVHRALEELSEEHRKILKLKSFEEVAPNDEVLGVLLGCSPGVARRKREAAKDAFEGVWRRLSNE